VDVINTRISDARPVFKRRDRVLFFYTPGRPCMTSRIMKRIPTCPSKSETIPWTYSFLTRRPSKKLKGPTISFLFRHPTPSYSLDGSRFVIFSQTSPGGTTNRDNVPTRYFYYVSQNTTKPKRLSLTLVYCLVFVGANAVGNNIGRQIVDSFGFSTETRNRRKRITLSRKNENTAKTTLPNIPNSSPSPLTRF